MNVTAVAEQTVYLNCKTSRKDAEKVEWRRGTYPTPLSVPAVLLAFSPDKQAGHLTMATKNGMHKCIHKLSEKSGFACVFPVDNQLLPANHRQYVFPNGTLAIQAVDARLDSGVYVCSRRLPDRALAVQLEYHLLVIIPPRIDPLVFPADLS